MGHEVRCVLWLDKLLTYNVNPEFDRAAHSAAGQLKVRAVSPTYCVGNIRICGSELNWNRW